MSKGQRFWIVVTCAFGMVALCAMSFFSGMSPYTLSITAGIAAAACAMASLGCAYQTLVKNKFRELLVLLALLWAILSPMWFWFEFYALRRIPERPPLSAEQIANLPRMPFVGALDRDVKGKLLPGGTQFHPWEYPLSDRAYDAYKQGLQLSAAIWIGVVSVLAAAIANSKQS